LTPAAPDSVPTLLASLSLVVAVGSLVAVTVIGRRTIRIGEAAVRAELESADVARRSLDSAESSRLAAEAASGRAAADAKGRRVERLLDVLIEMREMFNRQTATMPPGMELYSVPLQWPPSPEERERLALCRRLEVRLPPLEGDFDSASMVRHLARSTQWGSSDLETAIMQAKTLLLNTVYPNDEGLPPPSGPPHVRPL